MPLKLGDLLLKANIITQEQLDAALKTREKKGVNWGGPRPPRLLLGRGHQPRPSLHQFGVPVDQPRPLRDRPQHHQARPARSPENTYPSVKQDRRDADIARASDQRVSHGRHQVHDRLHVEPVVASEVALRTAIDKNYGTPRSLVPKERGKGLRRPGRRKIPNLSAVSARPSAEGRARRGDVGGADGRRHGAVVARRSQSRRDRGLENGAELDAVRSMAARRSTSTPCRNRPSRRRSSKFRT